ncbi:MAG: DUF2865 domain-containing protein [Roseitalea porphyridii]|uniref:DUF2865 domain-containing protein n=1 Tax=Roseitalea porphyridii TaxID=1852022 RepID=UPI0032D95142
MVSRVHSGCLACLWLIAIAIGAAALVGASTGPAQAQSCRALQSQLASARSGGGSRAQYRRYAEAAQRQARELIRAQRIYQSQRCAQSGSRQCYTLASTIRRMQSNLAELERIRDRNRGGASQREIRRLERAVQSACRPRETRTAAVRREPGTRVKLEPRAPAATVRPTPEPSFSGNNRTLCVRTCDGYFFPISFATSASNLERDAAICSALCPAAPTMLFTHRSGDDEGPKNMTALDGTPYTDLETAFSFRERERSADCTCGQADIALIGSDGAVQTAGQDDAAPETEAATTPSLRPAPRPDAAADPETAMNESQGLSVRRVVDIARSVSVGEIYDVAEGRDKIRVVGGEFLPDPEEAIDLTAPAPTPFP